MLKKLFSVIDGHEIQGNKSGNAVNPYDLSIVEEISYANEEIVKNAVTSAKASLQHWRNTSIGERASIIAKAAELIVANQGEPGELHHSEIMDLIISEMGKSIYEAEIEIFESADILNYYANDGVKYLSTIEPTLDQNLWATKTSKLIFEPVGVIGVIKPWNYPLEIPLWTIGAALLAGNTIVFKPSEITSGVGVFIERVFREAGLPRGVLNIILGDGQVGEYLVNSDVDMISFTGSTTVGKAISKKCSEKMIKCSLELGGKDAFIVCDDADIERAANGAVWGAFANAGQVCVAGERFFVQSGIFDKFVTRVIEITKTLKIGNGSDVSVDIAPLAFKKQYEKTKRLVDDAIAKGAKILLGGHPLNVDKLWRLENIENIKLLMQNRNYNKIITDKEGSDGIQAIFKLNRMMHLFIEFYASHENTISKIFIRDLGYDPIAKIVDGLLLEIVKNKAVVVGFTCLEIQRNFTLMIVDKLRNTHYEGLSFSGYTVIGGADPTRYKENYLKYFKNIDFIFMYEGEENFAALARKLISGKTDFSDIQNIVYRDGDSVKSTYNSNYSLTPCKIITPDFTGFELNKYLVPALPIHASRACYYALEKKNNCKSCSKYNINCNGKQNLQGCEQEENGCNFCVHYKTYSNYVERSANAVVDDIQCLYEKYGIKLFHLTDDALKPTLGTAISNEIIRRNLTDIRWLVYARFEPEFEYNILKTWFDAGVRVIEWGLESASQKVINNMNKNINMNDVRRILKISSNIGILNKLFLFHNHPSESVNDLKETLGFLLNLSYKEQIRLFPVVRNKMYLLKGTTLYDNWERFYLKVWQPSSIFSITAAYLEKEPYQEKARMVEQFVTEIKDLMKTKMVYNTDDENVMFDLLTIQMNENRHTTYYQCK